MKKEFVIGSVAAALAGLGTYQFVRSRLEEQDPRADLDQVWTARDIPDLTGKVIIVTGANSGLGFEAAKEFARQGARTILACRDMDKAQEALDRIRAEIPDAPAEIMEIDLASQASVRRFADAFKAKYKRLDVLVNNAGIMMIPYSTTEDGFERQLGVNHLGHFALTGLLIDLLLNTPGSRVVNVSSMGHRFGTMDFRNLMYEQRNGYSPMRAYGRSKLANLLFTYELQRRFEAAGADALALAAHPGTAMTGLTRYVEDTWYYKYLGFLEPVISQPASMGALPILRAATDPDVKGGQYYGPDGFIEQRGYPVAVESSDASHNVEDARQLWRVSEQLTGVGYGELDTAAAYQPERISGRQPAQAAGRQSHAAGVGE